MSLRFGRQVALSDVTLQCPAGGLTCLVGPNGAGKSSALALAAGLLRPNSGRVLVGSKPVAAFAHVDGVSYLPQSSFFPGLLTAREVLDFAIAVARPPRSRIAEVSHVTGIEEVIDRRIGELSGGWTRRLGLAVTLLQPAQAVLLDEPLVGLDPDTLDRLLGFLANSAQDGAAVVMATHEFEVIDSFSPRVVVLDEGRVIASYASGSGDSRRLYREALKGAANRIEARITDAG